jgi:short-subunit dehydrogenase
MSKIALITGASSGIGRELSRIHASRGGDLIIVARGDENLNNLKQELQKKYSCKIYVIVKDLSTPTASQEVYDEVKSQNLDVDYLFNNAGFGGQGYFHERDWEKDLAMINVNILALTTLTRLFLPGFVKKNSGRILNTSSSAALCPGPLQAVYYATKAYVTSFSNALAAELNETNITVSALMPGATNTKFAMTSGMSKSVLFKKTSKPYDIALMGYNGMLEGKLNIFAGIGSPLVNLLKFTPRRTIIKIIKKRQNV